MLDIEKLVPEAYIKDSRDFQLFCKLLGSVVNSSKYDCDSMLNVLNPSKCNNRFLKLLSTYVNYRAKNNPTDEDLRVILESYPYLIRYRGCEQGIKKAICLALKLSNIKDTDYILNISKDKIIQVSINEFFNIRYMKEFIELVKPVGYYVDMAVTNNESFSTTVHVRDNYTMKTQSTVESSAVTSSYVAEDATGITATVREIGRQEVISNLDDFVVVIYNYDGKRIEKYYNVTGYDQNATTTTVKIPIYGTDDLYLTSTNAKENWSDGSGNAVPAGSEVEFTLTRVSKTSRYRVEYNLS